MHFNKNSSKYLINELIKPLVFVHKSFYTSRLCVREKTKKKFPWLKLIEFTLFDFRRSFDSPLCNLVISTIPVVEIFKERTSFLISFLLPFSVVILFIIVNWEVYILIKSVMAFVSGSCVWNYNIKAAKHFLFSF